MDHAALTPRSRSPLSQQRSVAYGLIFPQDQTSVPSSSSQPLADALSSPRGAQSPVKKQTEGGGSAPGGSSSRWTDSKTLDTHRFDGAYGMRSSAIASAQYDLDRLGRRRNPQMSPRSIAAMELRQAEAEARQSRQQADAKGLNSPLPRAPTCESAGAVIEAGVKSSFRGNTPGLVDGVGQLDVAAPRGQAAPIDPCACQAGPGAVSAAISEAAHAAAMAVFDAPESNDASSAIPVKSSASPRLTPTMGKESVSPLQSAPRSSSPTASPRVAHSPVRHRAGLGVSASSVWSLSESPRRAVSPRAGPSHSPGGLRLGRNFSPNSPRGCWGASPCSSSAVRSSSHQSAPTRHSATVTPLALDRIGL